MCLNANERERERIPRNVNFLDEESEKFTLSRPF